QDGGVVLESGIARPLVVGPDPDEAVGYHRRGEVVRAKLCLPENIPGGLDEEAVLPLLDPPVERWPFFRTDGVSCCVAPEGGPVGPANGHHAEHQATNQSHGSGCSGRPPFHGQPSSWPVCPGGTWSGTLASTPPADFTSTKAAGQRLFPRANRPSRCER